MKICYTFNVKLVTSLLNKILRVLSHGSQLRGKKQLWFLSMMSLKSNYQFYHDARTFLLLHRIEAWNDVMKVTRLENFRCCTGSRLGMTSWKLQG